MKIAIINSVCGYGSTGRIMFDLAKVYMEQGHECILVYGRGNVTDEVRMQLENDYAGQYTLYRIGGQLAKINNYIHGLESRLLDNHGFSSRVVTKRFITWLQREKPDVIHLHNLHGYYINVEMLFRYIKSSHVKVIWTLHDCWSFTGHCSHYDYLKCDKWKTGCYHCPQKKEYPGSIFIDQSDRNYDRKKKMFTGVKDLTIVTPSRWLQNQVKQSFLKDYPITVIQNGIDLSVFSDTPMGRYKNKNQRQYQKKESTKYVVLGVASVWTSRKGLKYFSSLAKHLTEDYEILLIGLSEKQLENLESGKKKKSYLKKITGILRTDSVDELQEYYSMADVFVNPTLEEVLGLVNLEALACGTPVVTFDTGGSPECLQDDRNITDKKNTICGAIVAKENVKELCKMVRNVCEKKMISRKICREQAEKFDKKIMVEQYLRLL